jgi:hypothetical protein
MSFPSQRLDGMQVLNGLNVALIDFVDLLSVGVYIVIPMRDAK